MVKAILLWWPMLMFTVTTASASELYHRVGEVYAPDNTVSVALVVASNIFRFGHQFFAHSAYSDFQTYAY